MDIFDEPPQTSLFSDAPAYEVCDVLPKKIDQEVYAPKKRKINLNKPGKERDEVVARIREQIQAGKRNFK
jgi:flagellar basal body L-ring protein FlgH